MSASATFTRVLAAIGAAFAITAVFIVLSGKNPFTAYGLLLKILFNPSLRFGASIKVQSSLKPANAAGTWTIYTLDHDIEAMVPHGRWFTSLICYNPNFPRQVAT